MVTRITVIGMGYVGIPCAALLADVPGFLVTGLQRRSKRSGWKIEHLNAGKSPFEGDEPGLDELIAKVVAKGSFKVTDDVDVLKDSDVILIDVQTPTDENHVPQYDSLREVSKQIGERIKKGTLVVVESTVAPGTTQNVVQKIIEEKSGLKSDEDFDLAFAYERVMPGKLIRNIVHLPRIVGGNTPQSAKRAVDMYSKIVKAPVHQTDVLTAEVSKTIENAYRDVNIAFANEMALVCESLGVNTYEVIEFVNELDSRNMHIPGAGVGGHCLPKDTWLLRHGLNEYGSQKVEAKFISLAREINNYMPVHMTHLIEDALEKKGVKIQGATVTVLGIAYLENADDTRNTPALVLINTLEEKGAKVVLHDPYVQKWDLGPHEIERDIYTAAKDSDCLALVTRHRDYIDLNFSKLGEIMRTRTLVDGRNVYEEDKLVAHDFEYRAVGKVGLKG
ncbi:MAG: UDP-N-acetyl-D-mannosamine dehydrogenase [Candidatus Thorarchaeota archaeon AB_25]|nr:MAG: UDP-N-acetyl-D-mannosamine dehydrogenase [Candidatus Thorarchaeota archaeon AB_25]